MLCRNGLHPKEGPGKCAECKRARNRRFNRSGKRAAIDKRYAQSEKGKETRRRAWAKYYAESMTGFQYNLKLLKHRRYKALRARERRQSGQVSLEGRD